MYRPDALNAPISVSSNHGSYSHTIVSSLRESTSVGDRDLSVQSEDDVQTDASNSRSRIKLEDVDSTDSDSSPTMGMTKGARKAYRQVFQHTAEGANELVKDDGMSLAPTQIGGSYWTSHEKENFFAALTRYGPDDLPRLTAAVLTKSAPEVRFYLLLLRKEAERTYDLNSRAAFDPAQISVSVAIGEVCEAALTDAADILAREELASDVESERARFGESWLIDEHLANEIEGKLTQSGSEEPSGDSTGPRDTEMDDDNDETMESEGDHSVAGSRLPSAQQHSASESDTTRPNIPSADLLISSEMLHLSRTIFMNRSGADHWRKMTTVDRDISRRPAIWHSALDDLHELVVGRTRELVRASILQASSRIRASDARPQVVQEDVKTAMDLVNARPDWKGYWARMPRRSGIRVHSGHSKYHDGRPTHRYGVKLRYNEVEAELGVANDAIVEDNEEETEADVDEEENLGGKMEDSSNDDNYSLQSNDDSHSESGDSEEEETDFFEALDAAASYEEEARLLKLLGQDPPTIKKALDYKPITRRAKDEIDPRHTQWRKHVQYEPEWVAEMKRRAVRS